MKVWDKREFKDLDGIRTRHRNIKIALRRLRKFAHRRARKNSISTTIRRHANRGYLDIKLRPERRNAVKVLLFFDIGGSMDWHIKQVEELFSACKTEFKAHGAFLFPQLPVRGRVEGQQRRFTDKTATWQVLHPIRTITR